MDPMERRNKMVSPKAWTANATHLIALLALSLSGRAGTLDTAPSTPPNILVILLDDVGPEQLQCYDPAFAGGPGVEPGTNLYTNAYPYAPTPNISSLAREGVRFTRGFTTPICSPSRAMLMTGRYPFRNQIGQAILTNGETHGIEAAITTTQTQLLTRIPQLPDREVTLPEMMSTLAPNYELGLFGKWHLTASPCEVDRHAKELAANMFLPDLPFPVSDVDGEDHPFLVGWPSYRGVRANINGPPTTKTERCPGYQANRPDYFNWFYVHEPRGGMPGWTVCTDFNANNAPTCLVLDPPVDPTSNFDLTESVSEFRDDYLMTAIREDVEAFILDAEANQDPWLAIWTPQACHKPFTWPPQTLHDFGSEPPAISNPGPSGPPSFPAQWKPLKAMLQSFDTELGNLKNALSAGPGETIWDRTLVILLGDNGTTASAVLESDNPDAGGAAGLMSPYVLPHDYTFPGESMPRTPDPRQPSRFKGSPYVSGTNMICIISGAGVAAPGRTYGGLVDMVDIFSTIRELAGVAQDWPTTWAGPPPDHTNFAIDGISLCPVLESAQGVSPRTTSLSIVFAPNGPFDRSMTGDTRLRRAGYAKQLTTGEIYHYIRQQWVEKDGGEWNSVIVEPEHFYQLCDANGANVDTQEANDLADPMSPPAEMTTMSMELDTLLDSPDTY